MKNRVFHGTRRLRFAAMLLLLAMAGGVMAQTPAACTLPAAMAPSPEQTAWQLFVAANCPSKGKGGPLTWQNWTEQTCWLAPTTPGCSSADLGRRGSAVSPRQPASHPEAQRDEERHRRHQPARRRVQRDDHEGAGPAPEQLVPANLSASPTFCEEVYVNPAEASFVKAPVPNATLTTLAGQIAYAATHNPITFPTAAVEVKADWLPASSITPSFNCTTKKPAGVYVEVINGACYALAGIHISSKLAPNWLWATFEPQSSVSNPNRCNPKLYSVCNDPWGSSPAVSSGKPTAATKVLAQLMASAGLPAVFQNYRLVGVQTSFVTSGNKAIPLGNSFTEYNAEVLPQQAS